MSKGSKARRKQRSQQLSSVAPQSAPRPALAGEAEEIRAPSPSLSDALARAAETVATFTSNDTRTSIVRPANGTTDDRAAPASHAPEEEHFFAQGDEFGSYRPAVVDMVEEPRGRAMTRHVLERRARNRKLVTWVIGSAAALIAVVGLKAWLTRPVASDSTDHSLTVAERSLPSISLATPAEPATAPAEPAAAPAESAAAPAETAAAAPPPQLLPIVNVEIPAAPDTATEGAWRTAARSLSAQDFVAADRVFAELGRRPDAPTRETARLARAVWWMENGKMSEVRSVLADLAANATTPAVQRQARELLLSAN